MEKFVQKNKLLTFILAITVPFCAVIFFAKSNQKELGSHELSSESASTYQKICALPPQFIKPEIYRLYCRNRSCLRPGYSCTLSKSCCSGMCANSVCVASSEHQALPGEICENNSECFSNDCRPHPYKNSRICYGSTGEFCSRVSDTCTDNTNCCSGNCFKNRCLGSQKDPAIVGSYCYADNSECESYYCNPQSHRCE